MSNSISNKSFFITRTAMLLALALAVQFTLLRLFPGNPVITYVVGSILNMIFIIAALSVGPVFGGFIGLMTPIVAFLTGHLPFPVLIPFVAIANVSLIVIVGMGTKISKNKAALIIFGVMGAIVKFSIMALSAKFLLPLVTSLPAPALNKLAAAWSIPQIITALIGLALAISVKMALRKTNIIEMK